MITNLQIQHQNLRNMSILHLFHFPISEGIDPALWILASQRRARKKCINVSCCFVKVSSLQYSFLLLNLLIIKLNKLAKLPNSLGIDPAKLLLTIKKRKANVVSMLRDISNNSHFNLNASKPTYLQSLQMDQFTKLTWNGAF